MNIVFVTSNNRRLVLGRLDSARLDTLGFHALSTAVLPSSLLTLQLIFFLTLFSRSYYRGRNFHGVVWTGERSFRSNKCVENCAASESGEIFLRGCIGNVLRIGAVTVPHPGKLCGASASSYAALFLVPARVPFRDMIQSDTANYFFRAVGLTVRARATC